PPIPARSRTSRGACANSSRESCRRRSSGRRCRDSARSRRIELSSATGGRMGLLTKLLFFPLTGPVAGIRWSLEKVQHVVEEELTDDAPVRQELMELQMQLELGDITDEQYGEREAALMARLRDVRAWRERLGKGTSGGPVRVSRDDTEE